MPKIRLIQRTLVFIFSIVSLVSCNSGGGDDSGTITSNKIKLSGSIQTAGSATAGNPTGLQTVASKSVALYKIDDNGKIAGNTIDTVTSDNTGKYVFLLPDTFQLNNDLKSDLIVEATLDNDQTIRAIVIDETTDITPITEYVASKVIKDPYIDLSSLPADEILKLVSSFESLIITPQPNLSDMLTHLDELAATDVDTQIDQMTIQFNSRITLSGSLSSPSTTSPRNGKVSYRPVPDSTINLYRIDKTGNPIGGILASTTTDATGNYTLQLPEGYSLSTDLILQATVNGETITAFATDENQDINPVSQYVFSRIINDPDLLPGNIPVSDIVNLVTSIEALNIAETTDLQSTLTLIDSTAGSTVDSAINNIKVAVTSSPGFFGSSGWGQSSFH